MKSDRPFQKGLILGGLFFAALYLFVLVLAPHQDRYFIKYFLLFLASFLPAILAAIWAFFSRKTWTWIRFLVVTIIFFPPCLVLVVLCSNFLPGQPLPLPMITFSPGIPPSWTVEPEPPIIDMAKNPVGRQMGLGRKDHEWWIWIAAQNSPEDFDEAVVDWRNLMIEKAIDNGYQIRENNFALDMKNGRKIAQLYLAVKKNGFNFEIVNEAWMQRRFFVMCESIGSSVEATNNQEIADIFSSIIVK